MNERTGCTCKTWGHGVGYCPRHKMDKPRAWWDLCRSSQAYFEAWEQGRGPGQRPPKETPPPIRFKRPEGPGTQLAKVFEWFGIRPVPGCKCAEHIKQMNEWGPDECLKRIPEILNWLGEEARRQQLPFVKTGARALVHLAIRRSRKKLEENHGNTT